MCASLRNLQGIERLHCSPLFRSQLILGEHLIHVLDEALPLLCFHSQSVEQSIEIVRFKVRKSVVAVAAGRSVRRFRQWPHRWRSIKWRGEREIDDPKAVMPGGLVRQNLAAGVPDGTEYRIPGEQLGFACFVQFLRAQTQKRR